MAVAAILAVNLMGEAVIIGRILVQSSRQDVTLLNNFITMELLCNANMIFP